VTRYQDARDLPANGRMTPRTWTALLTEGPTPLIKVGSASHAVRRAQRALNAAISVRLPVTGVFDAATTQAVRAYQKERHLRRTGVIAADTWAQLRAGRR
jgi:peptidoglycan hydrolase-like protein with peptidoglycan-binding domain